MTIKKFSLSNNQIVELEYDNIKKIVKNILKNSSDYHLRDDLTQDICLILLCQSNENLIKLHKKNQVVYFATRIILNQVKSKTSPFYKKYKKKFKNFGNI